MTKMEGVGVTQCKNCHYCIELYRMMCCCGNANSDHYGHMIIDFHPICNDFIQKGGDKR